MGDLRPAAGPARRHGRRPAERQRLAVGRTLGVQRHGRGRDQLRREQWFTEGLFSQLSGLSHIRYAVNPQLVGDVLDNHFEAPR